MPNKLLIELTQKLEKVLDGLIAGLIATQPWIMSFQAFKFMMISKLFLIFRVRVKYSRRGDLQ